MAKMIAAAAETVCEKWYLAHRQCLFGYLCRLCRDESRAEDLLQSTFEKACRASSSYEATALRPWLLAIARNAFYDEQRKRRPGREVLCRDDVVSGGHGLATEASPADRVELRELLQQLPERHRNALLLTQWWGYSDVKAAELLGTRPGTIKAWAHRGRRRLQATQTREGPDR